MACEGNLLNYSTPCGHEKRRHHYYCLPGAEGEWLCLARGKALIRSSEGCLHVPAVGVAVQGSLTCRWEDLGCRIAVFNLGWPGLWQGRRPRYTCVPSTWNRAFRIENELQNRKELWLEFRG